MCCNRIMPWTKMFDYFLFGTSKTSTSSENLQKMIWNLCFFTFPFWKSPDGVFAERSWRTWEMGWASKKGQPLLEKISCIIWQKKNTFTWVVCSCFPRGDLKQIKVVLVGMPGSGAKSLASRWTTDTMEQPSNPGSVMMVRNVPRSRISDSLFEG